MQYWIWKYKEMGLEPFERLREPKIYIFYDIPCATVCRTKHPSVVEESPTTEYAGIRCGWRSWKANLPPYLSYVGILSSNNFRRVEAPAEGVSSTDASGNELVTWSLLNTWKKGLLTFQVLEVQLMAELWQIPQLGSYFQCIHHPIVHSVRCQKIAGFHWHSLSMHTP